MKCSQCKQESDAITEASWVTRCGQFGAKARRRKLSVENRFSLIIRQGIGFGYLIGRWELKWASDLFTKGRSHLLRWGEAEQESSMSCKNAKIWECGAECKRGEEELPVAYWLHVNLGLRRSASQNTRRVIKFCDKSSNRFHQQSVLEICWQTGSVAKPTMFAYQSQLERSLWMGTTQLSRHWSSATDQSWVMLIGARECQDSSAVSVFTFLFSTCLIFPTRSKKQSALCLIQRSVLCNFTRSHNLQCTHFHARKCLLSSVEMQTHNMNI